MNSWDKYLGESTYLNVEISAFRSRVFISLFGREFCFVFLIHPKICLLQAKPLVFYDKYVN
jgi:hypothetical protein